MNTVVQINTVVNFGSTGRIVEEIGQLALKMGWNHFICYGRDGRRSRSKTIKIGNDWDTKWHGIQTRLFDRHGLASTRATMKLIERIKDIKPDVIHLHNLHGYYLNIRVLFNYLSVANIPIIWTFNECWTITGNCAHFSSFGCDKWKSECNHCPQKRKYPASYMIDRSRKNYRLKKQLFTSVRNMTIVAVSNWLADIIKASFLIDYPVKTIYNGIDTCIFRPRSTKDVREKNNIPYKKFIILAVANVWDERKGLRYYIQLSKLLKDDEIIVMVGVTEKILKKLPLNIIGIKRTENVEQLAELYSLASIACNFSSEETFGITNAEALACGTPSIVYKCTASPELIGPGAGFVVDEGDMVGIRNVIDAVKIKGKESYSKTCRERAVKMFNKDERWGEYIQLYQQVISEHPVKN